MNNQLDIATLDKALAHDLEEDTRSSFENMRTYLRGAPARRLSAKQRAWVHNVLDHHEPTYENLVSEGKVPRGREVELLVKDKPLRPPRKCPSPG